MTNFKEKTAVVKTGSIRYVDKDDVDDVDDDVDDVDNDANDDENSWI